MITHPRPIRVLTVKTNLQQTIREVHIILEVRGR